MRRETRRDLIRRILAHLNAGTTDLAERVFRNPVSAYTSRERHERERDVLFRRYPLLLGMSCQVASAGDCLVDDAAGVPIVVVRGPDRRLRAFMNVCRHRGAQVVGACGRGMRALSCPYHGWTYDLDGRLIDVPGEEAFQEIAREEHVLRPLPVVEKYGLVWVRPAEDGALVDIDAYLAALAPELESYGFETFAHFETRTLRPQINWKVAVDTFLEAYHLDTLHRRTVSPIFFGNLCLSDAFGPHNRMVAVRRTFPQLRGQADPERDFLRHTIELYTIFPNAVLVHQADHVELWRMYPDRAREDACAVHLSLYVPEAVTTEKARSHWAANMELAMSAVAEEDFRLGEGMQRGFYAGAQERVTYGRNEPALIHFHESVRGALELDIG
jgi:phenylpropionate dioxygenase-like ring-hydroxylating dioxygenase large terminal subunit